ncbi:Putative Fusarubin cluster-oxidoreductase [[Torrubiella] hemipterigena]|uniref:Putative Fusarubin cluster-oxidoreductase n=1 Tax=[Torrubiella] hemipterigena TaxID=1531966 RepID=A0A0A1T863_9HYPO|nr:Putative Fusarubin cluster-oxidoreductase [[Torrubiella] hemipterigena]
MTRILATSLLLAASCAAAVTAKTNSTQEGCKKILLEDFESLGAWYDGVAKINDNGCTPQKRDATIAIIGGGVSGLATALMLDSVGVHNWEILEASERIGGRFRTVFVGNTQEYAEMGPMRLPYSMTYKSDNSTHEYTDHRMTFQLADWLNELNHHEEKWKVEFIPWIQHHDNELLARGTGRHPDGRIPTRADIAKNPKLGKPAPMDTEEYKHTKALMNDILKNETTIRSIQKDVWRAHKAAMDLDYDSWSQQSLMRNQFKASENVTDAIWTSTDYDVLWDEMTHNSNLAQDGGAGTLGETEWKCVDGGFNRLTDAFMPHVQSKLNLHTKVTKLEPIDNDGRVRITSKSTKDKKAAPTTKDYDYAIMAVPFPMTRFMDLPEYSSVLGRAISEAGLRFKSACKVALLFQERFWEKGERPIFGGKSEPVSNAVGALYYPVYGLNESRPGLITHYRGGDWSDRMVSMSDDQHADMVLESIVSLHGEVAREQYTGNYTRLCWLQDEFTSTAWCRPDIEQHSLYIPSYHKTEHKTIFIGEHTAPTHAWISSSLHSSARGSIQLLLELGLTEEAKAINEQWMGRWIQK